IIESLTFCYDDNIAHELFDNLLKANNKNALKYKASILKMLYIETQIELTQEEQQEFDKILEEESDNSKNILLESYKKSEFENFEKIYGRYLQEDEKQLTK
ncbi:MAG: hypothetical protein J5689_02555, partial [Clostridia bacterium]|nr:hypothetical protein [Clostridia bacterium]